MADNNKSRTVAIVAIALFLLALSWAIFQVRTNDALKKEVDNEKLAYENVFSEKLSKEKEIMKIKGQLAALEESNGKLTTSLHDQSLQLAGKDNEINRLHKDNSVNKKRYAELDALKKKLEKELIDLNNTIQQLQVNNADLNSSIASLQQKNQLLSDELKKAHTAYYDKPLIEASRGKNDKLMAKASRTKKLKATVMVPASLANVQFKITDPKGKLISGSEDGTLATRIVNKNANASASLSTASAGEIYNEVEMVFLPKKKLTAGVYHIEVTSENLAVGNLQIRLR